MNSGLMDILITYETPVYSDNAYGKGAKPSSWTTGGTFWGRVVYNGGSEGGSDKKEFRESISVQGHYIDMNAVGLTSRLSFDSKYWNVTSKATIGRNQYIRLEAVAVD